LSIPKAQFKPLISLLSCQRSNNFKRPPEILFPKHHICI